MRANARFLLPLVLCACPSSESEPTLDPVIARTNCELYTENCYGCHGPDAHGHGPHGMHLDPAPSDLRSPASINKGHETLLALVRDGLPETGMPAFADLLDENEMRATLQHVDALEAGTAAACDATADSDTDQGSESTDGVSDATTGPSTSTSTSTSTTTSPDSQTTGPAATSSGTGSPESESSSGSSTSTTGATVSRACEAWCGCLDAACSDLGGYPFGSIDECHTECAIRTDAEIACWQGFCESVAEQPALADHNCEHAWGGLGLAEC